MSISMNKADGVTVLTLTSDPQSSCPPLCQILKALCYNPICCSVSQRLGEHLRTSQTVLGTLQIMIGLLNIGLGAIIFISNAEVYVLQYTMPPVWLGVLFMVFGTVCILSEKYPSQCLVTVNVILNLAGVVFAITGIVLYSIGIGYIYLWQRCDRDYGWYDRETTPSPSRWEKTLQEQCLWYKDLFLMLVRGIIGVLIVLSTLELCVTISASVLGIKALKKMQKGENKGTDDPEYYKPLLEDGTTN